MKMKNLTAAGALLVIGVALTGCGGVIRIGGPDQHDEVTYEVAKVGSLSVESGTGDITVTESNRTGVKVVETVNWRGDDKPKTQHPLIGDQLTLSYNCSDTPWSSCSVSYRIEVPKGLKIKADSGTGTVTARDLTGLLEATTGTGEIEMRNISGDLELHTGTGDIKGVELAGKRLTGDVGTGDVDLKYTGAPESIDFSSGAGDVTVRVPDVTYDVEVKSGTGDDSVRVKSDPSSPRKIVLTTGAGDATVLAE